MTRISKFLRAALWLILVAAGTASAQSFEGLIRFEVYPDAGAPASGPNGLKYYVKDSKIRMEFEAAPQQSAAIIYDAQQAKMTMLMDQMKAYMTLPTDKYAEQYQQQMPTDQPYTRAGKTKTVAGRTCELWISQEDGETTEMWVAKGMGSFMMPDNQPGPLMKSQPEWLKEAMEGGFMPLEISTTENGKTRLVMKATSVEPGKLDAELFSIPDGYNDMSGMMQQFQDNQQ